MAATLPDLETVTLRRGASNGAELRIELNRPERMNAWDKQLGLDLLAAVELAAGDDARPRGDDHRRRAARSPPAPTCAPASTRARRRAARRRHGAARALPPDHHRHPAHAEAGARGGQRPGRRDRLLARARVRPRAGRRVGLPAARVRQHRSRSRRRLVGLRSRARGRGTRRRRWRCWASACPPRRRARGGWSTCSSSDDSFADEVDALAERLATGPTRAYAAAKEQLNARVYAGLDEQLELEASLQDEMAGSADFGEGVLAFLEKRPPRFAGE